MQESVLLASALIMLAYVVQNNVYVMCPRLFGVSSISITLLCYTCKRIV